MLDGEGQVVASSGAVHVGWRGSGSVPNLNGEGQVVA